MHSHGLVTGETAVVYFTMHSSGFILGLTNRYHGYNIVSLLSDNGTEFREICYTGSPLQYKECYYIPLSCVRFLVFRDYSRK
jgi:hypothetical protein